MEQERVNANALYRALNRELVPVMRVAGYRRYGSGSTWIRKHGTRYLAAGATANRWGWDPWLGSHFTWGYSLDATPEETAFANTATLWELASLLTDDELLEIQAKIGIAVSALPPPEAVPEDDGHRYNRSTWGAYLDSRKPPQLPSLQTGPWLRLYTIDDVREWGSWLAGRVPDLEIRLRAALPPAVSG